MEHVGIDLGARRSHVVVMSSAGEVRHRRQLATRELASWLSKRDKSRVLMEACTQSCAVSRAATDAGHIVFVVPGTVVRALGVGARGIKTDDRDAEVLARASVRNEQLPSVHTRSNLSRSRRELMSTRATLVKARTSIALNIKSWLRGRLMTVKGRGNTIAFCEAVRRVALEHPDGLPDPIERLLVTFEHLTEQIDALQEQIEEIAKSDPVCQRLMTVPGVGPIVSLAFVTQVDDIGRFASSEELASYMALVPGEATTGGKIKRTKTIQAGPTRLKSMLVQAAWSAWMSRPNDPMVQWARLLADKKGKRIAIVALARKLATVLYAIWKHDTAYDAARASTVRSTTGSSTG